MGQALTEKGSCPVLCLFVQTPVNLGDFLHPLLTLRMLKFEYLRVRPVKVVCNVRYLFIEPLYGVAPDPPGLSSSTSNCRSQ
jgi:hypothetical protein